MNESPKHPENDTAFMTVKEAAEKEETVTADYTDLDSDQVELDSDDTDPAEGDSDTDPAEGDSDTDPAEGDSDTDEDVSAHDNEDDLGEATDYEAIIRDDLARIRSAFPEAEGLQSITELKDPLRYAALRDLGLTAEEAYSVTQRIRRHPDNRSHLSPSVPGGGAIGSGYMTEKELIGAREIFEGLSDRELRRLYKKVTR